MTADDGTFAVAGRPWHRPVRPADIADGTVDNTGCRWGGNKNTPKMLRSKLAARGGGEIAHRECFRHANP